MARLGRLGGDAYPCPSGDYAAASSAFAPSASPTPHMRDGPPQEYGQLDEKPRNGVRSSELALALTRRVCHAGSVARGAIRWGLTCVPPPVTGSVTRERQS